MKIWPLFKYTLLLKAIEKIEIKVPYAFRPWGLGKLQLEKPCIINELKIELE